MLDALRGFALFGILVMNIPGFSKPVASWFVDEPIAWGIWDQVAVFVKDVFFDGKFNSIFSFLFGVGWTLQLERARARGVGIGLTQVRRMLVLLAIGMLHVVYLWIGDVLQLYALLGLFLLLIRNVSDRAIMILIVFCFLARPMAELFTEVAAEPERGIATGHMGVEERKAEQVRIFRDGSYLEQMRERWREWCDAYLVHGDGWFLLDLGLTMLLGVLAGRQGWFEDVGTHRESLTRVARICLPAGLMFAVVEALVGLVGRDPDWPEGWQAWIETIETWCYDVARPILAVGYMTTLALVLERPGWGRMKGWLAATGRMPLTNYLLQSVIMTTLCNSYGMRWFGRISPAAGIILAVLIYCTQVVYSEWWLREHAFGPLEWVWRVLTYGRVARRQQAVTGQVEERDRPMWRDGL